VRCAYGRSIRGYVRSDAERMFGYPDDERYISRIIPLAFLAPNITEAILEGEQVPHLSLEKCVGKVPFEWSQQRVAMTASVDVE
jgi:hypothetical protein